MDMTGNTILITGGRSGRETMISTEAQPARVSDTKLTPISRAEGEKSPGLKTREVTRKPPPA
jgi:hypothetical protein